MAASPYTGVPETQAPPAAPNVYQTPQTIATPAGAFGAATAAGVESAAKPLHDISDIFGKVAADDAANKYQEGVNKILYGDPSAKGPDGRPDTGYMGLKGDAALQAREDVVKRIESLRTELTGGLSLRQSKLQFDEMSRRYKAITDAQVGNHARTQANVYAQKVNTATIKLAEDDIARAGNDPDKLRNAEADMVGAYVKIAELNGGGPELLREAHAQARRHALATRLDAIAVDNPRRALDMLEQDPKVKEIFGSQYDNMVSRFKQRGRVQYGREVADGMLTGSAPPKGDDAMAVVRHYEGFISEPKMDTDGRLRVGYGSDTVTKADGTVVPVTSQTVVTREDAERDLARRVGITQKDIQGQIGSAAWNALSPQSKASLTSIVYNYGNNWKAIQPVLDAAKSGDAGALATAIRGLAGHNSGINARRRAGEAANIAPGEAVPGDQAQMIAEVKARGMAPEAESAAIARINQSFALQHKAETQKKVEFNQRVNDTLAESATTGAPPAAPVSQEDFVRHLGPSEGAAKYTEYTDNLVYNADHKALEGMSDIEQRQSLIERVNKMPAPGAPGYANAIAKHEKLVKAVEDIQKARREDPSGAVANTLAVKEAMAQVRKDDPGSQRRLAETRLTAQERLGIEPEYRSPITKAEALQLTTPLDHPIPGEEGKAVAQVASRFREMFGENAQQAFAYALRVRKVNEQVAQQTASVFKKLGEGTPITTEDAARFDAARAEAAERAAVQGRGAPGAGVAGGAFQSHRPGSAQDVIRRSANPDEGPQFEGAPVVEGAPVIPPDAINYLLRNPQTGDAFDKTFGRAGAAKEILEKYKGITPGLP